MDSGVAATSRVHGQQASPRIPWALIVNYGQGVRLLGRSGCRPLGTATQSAARTVCLDPHSTCEISSPQSPRTCEISAP
jgi:hypothetical protein